MIVDPQIVQNVLGFMERAQLKGSEVPAYNRARAMLEGIIREAQEQAREKEKAPELEGSEAGEEKKSSKSD